MSSNITSTSSSTTLENSFSCITVVELGALSVGRFHGVDMASVRGGSCCGRLSRMDHSEGDVRLEWDRLNLPEQHNSKACKTLSDVTMLMYWKVTYLLDPHSIIY